MKLKFYRHGHIQSGKEQRAEILAWASKLQSGQWCISNVKQHGIMSKWNRADILAWASTLQLSNSFMSYIIQHGHCGQAWLGSTTLSFLKTNKNKRNKIKFLKELKFEEKQSVFGVSFFGLSYWSHSVDDDLRLLMTNLERINRLKKNKPSFCSGSCDEIHAMKLQ